MKPSTKRSIAVSCFLLALGCFLMAAGWGMGGRPTSGRGISIGGSNGIYVGPAGIQIGGANGIYVGPEGIRIGGSHGIESTEMGQIFETSPVTQLIQVDSIPSDPSMSEISERFQNGFTQLTVDVDLADIRVEHGSGYGVTLSWNIKDYELRYDYDGDQLQVWSESGSRGHMGQVNLSATVVITVPVSAKLEYVSLQTALGDIYWSAKSTLYDAQLSTNLGNVYWAGKSRAESATLETDLGDIWVHGLTANNLWTVSDLGDITLEIPRSGDEISYDFSTALGSVSVYGKDHGEDYTYTARGEDVRYIEARCSLGDITLTDPPSDD